MPYKVINPPEPMIDQSFVDAIVEEMRPDKLDSESSPDAPTIVEERIRGSSRIHVTVIWDRWGQVGPEERSRIILEAYETALGPGTFLTLTSALGLTQAEAKKLGVENGMLYAA